MKRIGKQLLSRLIFIAIAIGGAILTAAIAVFITSLFTSDRTVIVNATLLSVWTAEVALYIARCRYLYRRNIAILRDKKNPHLENEKRWFVKWYTATGTVFALFSGLLFWTQRHAVASNTQSGPAQIEPDIHLRIIKWVVSGIFATILLVRFYRKRQQERLARINETK